MSFAETSYAEQRQKHISLIDRLRAIGAKDLDFPRVVVIGDQSADKSILVEAISGVTVPQDAGINSRCPIEYRMSTSGGTQQWSCQIYIRWEAPSNGSHVAGIRETPFGGRITDKADVELMLRRAQAAALTQDKDIDRFVELTFEELQLFAKVQLQYSRNVVCIDLSAPNMTNLAFIDLPGLDQNGNADIAGGVEELVSSCIKGNDIVLVALSASDEPEKQKAMQLAQQADPHGQRTMGVIITKVDNILPGSTQSLWLDFIEGRRLPLKLGYFCMLQPNEDDGRSHVAHEHASVTVDSTFLPGFSTHLARFGADNVVAALSGHLSQMTAESFQALTTEMQRLREVFTKRLHKTPQPPISEPFGLILNLLHEFCTELRTMADGQSSTASLIQHSRKIYATFKSDVRNTAPLFVPSVSKLDRAQISQELLTVDDGEAPQFIDTGKQISLVDVRNRIQSLTADELPGNIPYAAKIVFVKEFEQTWPSIVNSCAHRSVQSLRKTIESLTDAKFGAHQHLRAAVTKAIEALVQLRYAEATAQLQKFMKYESGAYTQNDHYLLTAKETFFAQYKVEQARIVAPPRSSLISRKSKRRSRANSTPSPALPVIIVYPPEQTQPLLPEELRYASPGTSSVLPGFQKPVCEQVPETIFQSVAGLEHLSSWSHEELRLRDYQDGRKGPYMSSDQGLASGVKPSTGQPPNDSTTSSDTSDLSGKEQSEGALGSYGNKQLRFSGIALADSDDQKPKDQYEAELLVMAEVRAYFNVAYKRIIDNVPLALNHELLYPFAENSLPYLLKALGLSDPTEAASKCDFYVAQDPSTVADQQELQVRLEELLKTQSELETLSESWNSASV
ncbi:hypothetical protein BDW22DRAFT_1359373 [Trametopsis cervina]|nr:hypothetical protein BDW22DRAFT_1359373 [Trametopsis cervina]